MGDGANLALGYAMDDWEQLQDYNDGNMSQEDAYDSGIIDERGRIIGNPSMDFTRKNKNPSKYTKTGERKKYSYTCRYCGKSGLQWKEEGGKWRLFNNRKVAHTCDKYIKEDHEENK